MPKIVVDFSQNKIRFLNTSPKFSFPKNPPNLRWKKAKYVPQKHKNGKIFLLKRFCQVVADSLKKHFPNVPVLPSIGNHESFPVNMFPVASVPGEFPQISRGLSDIKYDVPVCHSCHKMIIRQANLLGPVHILKPYTFQSEFRTLSSYKRLLSKDDSILAEGPRPYSDLTSTRV